jgi:hypothetical protein
MIDVVCSLCGPSNRYRRYLEIILTYKRSQPTFNRFFTLALLNFEIVASS